ncbi:MAG: chorismate synthase [Bacteroidales bacterium]|nr:chorismate synthase [Bacteroidales bacterium]
MNSFGNTFRVSLFGESHGPAVGVTIDGCPSGIEFTTEEIVTELSRRRSGKPGTTPRAERDIPVVLSGYYNGFSTGSPITIITHNSDIRSSDYDDMVDIPRPGHADFTSHIKYGGFSDHRGGGHFSGRITWGLVVAGVIARKILGNVTIRAELISAGGKSDIDGAIEEARSANDTIGGIVECRVDGLPAGIGEPFFQSVESAISSIVFSIPAIKGIEFGSGFATAGMRGSQNNDPIVDISGKTSTNNSGGINGGITNGNQLFFRVAVKPASSIGIEQESISLKTGKRATLEVKGRHDTLIALRVPVIVESAAAIALADLLITDRGINFNSARLR